MDVFVALEERVEKLITGYKELQARVAALEEENRKLHSGDEATAQLHRAHRGARDRAQRDPRPSGEAAQERRRPRALGSAAHAAGRRWHRRPGGAGLRPDARQQRDGSRKDHRV